MKEKASLLMMIYLKNEIKKHLIGVRIFLSKTNDLTNEALTKRCLRLSIKLLYLINIIFDKYYI